MRIDRRIVSAIVVALAFVQQAGAQTQQTAAGGRPLTLDEAVRRARENSEQVVIARSDVQRASGELYRARSEYFPQLNGSLSYTRTLKSEFSALQGDSTAFSDPCADFVPNPSAPVDQRVTALELAMVCRNDENPFSGIFDNLPFGREHQWNLGLFLSQAVYTGGRVHAQSRAAKAGQRNAEIGLNSTTAQIQLDVTEAYYNALLSDQLLGIAELTLAQLDTTLSQVRLARQVGDRPEFDLLRAQVARDNQRPVVIQRRADRDLTHIRLKQLLNLPLDGALQLTTPLVENATQATLTAESATSDTVVAQRAPVRQAAEFVNVSESQVKIAKSQRLPSLTVSSQYGRVGYPTGSLPAWNQFRSNWTVTAAVNMPLLTGGRLHGDKLVADANLISARARLQETKERAALDARDAVERLRAAEASWLASAGTVEQAVRSHTIAEVRFREGISTQLELDDARIGLQQAQANRAVAARDVQVARARVALLRDLPLSQMSGLQLGVPNTGAAGTSTVQMPSVPRTPPVQQARPGLPVQASRTGND
jgi:outer membrane protein TolC